jgi:hypothetical protein
MGAGVWFTLTVCPKTKPLPKDKLHGPDLSLGRPQAGDLHTGQGDTEDGDAGGGSLGGGNLNRSVGVARGQQKKQQVRARNLDDGAAIPLIVTVVAPGVRLKPLPKTRTMVLAAPLPGQKPVTVGDAVMRAPGSGAWRT